MRQLSDIAIKNRHSHLLERDFYYKHHKLFELPEDFMLEYNVVVEHDLRRVLAFLRAAARAVYIVCFCYHFHIEGPINIVPFDSQSRHCGTQLQL